MSDKKPTCPCCGEALLSTFPSDRWFVCGLRQYRKNGMFINHHVELCSHLEEATQ